MGSSALPTSGGEVLPALLPILLPFAALALPVVDLVLAYIRRTLAGRYWFVADKQHLHHRLIARGHSHRGAVFLMWGWTAVVSFGLVFVSLNERLSALSVVLLAAALVAVLTIWPVRPASGGPRSLEPPLEDVPELERAPEPEESQ